MTAQHQYAGKSFQVPDLFLAGEVFYPEMIKAPIISGSAHHYDPNPFEVAKFNSPSIPSGCGYTEQTFSTRKNLRILDLPIKMSGNSEYRLPQELSPWTSTIKRIVNLEHYFNPEVEKFYAYLTLDQGWLESGTTQRTPGCHVDGFQGARITDKHVTNRSYIVSDIETTCCYLQPFEVFKLDPAKHNFFHEFDRQADESKIWRPEPYQIVLLGAYNVHRAAVASQRCYRTFLRVSYDIRRFDRLGNTHNPMFNYDWEMVPRETQQNLTDYEQRQKTS